jgi:hypothetical protein
MTSPAAYVRRFYPSRNRLFALGVTEEAACLGHTRRALFIGVRFRAQVSELEREPLEPIERPLASLARGGSIIRLINYDERQCQ